MHICIIIYHEYIDYHYMLRRVEVPCAAKLIFPESWREPEAVILGVYDPAIEELLLGLGKYELSSIPLDIQNERCSCSGCHTEEHTKCGQLHCKVWAGRYHSP